MSLILSFIFAILFFLSASSYGAIEIDKVECLSSGWPGQVILENPFICEPINESIIYWDSDLEKEVIIPVGEFFRKEKSKIKDQTPCNPIIFGNNLYLTNEEMGEKNSNLACLDKMKEKKRTLQEIRHWSQRQEKIQYGYLALFDIIFQKSQELAIDFVDAYAEQNNVYKEKLHPHLEALSNVLVPEKKSSFDKFVNDLAAIIKFLNQNSDELPESTSSSGNQSQCYDSVDASKPMGSNSSFQKFLDKLDQ